MGLAVMQATGNSQQPWVSASPIRGTFHFVISGEITISPPAAGRMSEAAEAWAATQNSTSMGVLQAFADRYSSTVCGRMARARIEELKRVKAAPIPGSSRLQTAEVAPPVRPNLPCTSRSSAGVSLSSRAARPLSVDEECALKPKDVFRECDKCPDMVVVPTGTFTMGAPANELDGSDRERPQHVVTIAQPLAVGKFAVTVDQFEAFMRDTHGQAGSSCRTLEGGKMEERTGRSWRDPGFPQNGAHPAVCINFADAEAYVDWLSTRTGKRYRLLTEAEWEYAARAGTTTRFFFGNDEKDLCHYGNGTDVAAKLKVPGLGPAASCNDGYAYAAPVGSFAANAFGLYDMHGNERQWVEDCFHASYAGAPGDGSAWESTDCAARVQRGGAWGYRPANLRSAYRDGVEPVLRRSFTGFRVARAL
jgi:formylglycine-generating enzyme required for sulfatase activity